MKVRNLNWKKLGTISILINILLISTLTYVIFASPNGTFTISKGFYPGAPSYTIWKEGSTYYAKNAYGAIDYSGTAAILNSSLNALANSGVIYLKSGTYSTNLDFGSKTIILIGEGLNTVIDGNIDLGTSVGSNLVNLKVTGQITYVQASKFVINVFDNQTYHIYLVGGTSGSLAFTSKSYYQINPWLQIANLTLAQPLVFDTSQYMTIREAPGSGVGYWVGAPQAFYDRKTGYIYLTYRWRDPTNRGYQADIARSKDGVTFETIKTMTRDSFGVVGSKSLERACILRDPVTGKFKYYICIDSSGWDNYKLTDVDDPANFDPSTATLVFSESGVANTFDVDAVKDPHVITVGRLYYMMYAGRNGTTKIEQTGIAYSVDGVNWIRYSENPIIETGTGNVWDNRTAKGVSILPYPNAWIIYYTGKNDKGIAGENTRHGYAVWFPPNVGKPVKMTANQPLMQGPIDDMLYLQVLVVPELGKAFAYYQTATADGSHDLVVSIIDL